MEIRPIPGIVAGFFATDTGEILTTRRKNGKPGRFGKMVLKHSRLNNRGYRQGNFGYQQYSYHRLICAAFHGEAPSISSQARHLNGNRLDNRPANLKWGSAVDNQCVDGKKSNRLDPAKVLEIRRQLMAGVPRPVLQRHYDISAGLLHCLAYNKIWRLGDAIPPGFEDWQAMKLMPLATCTEELDYLPG